MILLNRFTSRSLALAAVSLALAGFAGTAFADDDVPAPEAAAARHAPQGTPANVSGAVARYVVGPLGHVRGFILKDGTAVTVHGTAGDGMAKQVPVGEVVRVEGFSPAASGGKEVMHASVFGQHGQVVAPPARGDRPHDPGARKAEREQERAAIAKLPDASANGTVEAVMLGRKGKPDALVLTDGTSVILSHSLSRQLMSRGVRVGDRIQSSGKGATYPVGASVYVRSIAFADGTRFEAKSRHDVQPG
jgi:hypothetical protein